MTVPILDELQLLENLKAQANKFFPEYYAFYSSWYGGIIKNPHLMLIPTDDHMVHRGDGVFEAIKMIDHSIYLLDEHLARLFASAEKVSIKSNISQIELKKLVLQTAQAANQKEAMIRIFLSRGPGSFSVNPYDSVAPQIYIMVHKPHPLPEHKYQKGVKIGKSKIGIKPSWLSQVKSCNYLLNVLMKKEAIDNQLDFVFNTDDIESITESSTENIMIVDKEGCLVHPKLDFILKGTTMTRICELAKERKIPFKIQSISLDDLVSAQEVMIVGTTLNVLPAVQFEDKIIGNGSPGPITQKLLKLLQEDIQSGIKSTAIH